ISEPISKPLSKPLSIEPKYAPGSKKPWLLYAAAGAALILVLFLGVYFILPSGGSSSNSQQPTITVQIEVTEGRAEVYDPNGNVLGTTPYSFSARVGDEIDYVLKQNGFVDQPVKFDVSEGKKVYTFTMKKN